MTARKTTMTDLRSASIEQLRAELARRESEEAEAPPSPLANPDWKQVHATVCEGIARQWIDRYRDDDLRAYVYETAVEAVFGKGIFEKLNRRCP